MKNKNLKSYTFVTTITVDAIDEDEAYEKLEERLLDMRADGESIPFENWTLDELSVE